MTEAEATPAVEPDYGGHPLFPRPETESGRDPRKFDLIQIIRFLPDGSRETCPRTFKGSELRSWQHVYDMFGGGQYQAVAQCEKTHRYQARSDRVNLSGPSKPFHDDGKQVLKQDPNQPVATPPTTIPGAPVPYYVAAPAPASSPDMLALMKCMFESNANVQSAILRAALDRQTAPQPNPMEMIREFLPLLQGIQGNGSGTKALLQGVQLAKELLRSVGHAPAPASSGGDDLSELAGMVKLFMSAKSGASAAPAPAPAPSMPPQSAPGWPPAGWAPPGWPPPGWPPYAMGGQPWPWYGPPGYYPGMPPQAPYTEPVPPQATPPVAAPPRAPVPPAPRAVPMNAPVAPAPVAPAPASASSAAPPAQAIEAPPVPAAPPVEPPRAVVAPPAIVEVPWPAVASASRPATSTFAAPVEWTSPEPGDDALVSDEELVLVEDVPSFDHDRALGQILEALKKPPHAGAMPAALASAIRDEGFRDAVSSILPEEAKQGFYMLLAQQVGGGV